MKTINLLLLILAIIGVALFFFCARKPIDTAVESEIIQAYKGLYGKLVDNGGKPVSGAAVKAVSTEYSPTMAVKKSVRLSSDSNSASTDDSGYYSFESLTAGTYNLLGDYKNGNLTVLITGVRYDSAGADQEVRTDTLRPPGQISGSVETHTPDNGGILSYIPGTSFLAITDDTGSFVLSNIPQGTYTVAFRNKNLMAISDTGIQVFSGKRTLLPEKEMEADPAYPPPTPDGLTVSYDSLHGRVFLAWKPVWVADVAGYVVYRNDTSFAIPQRLNDYLIVDAGYIDTVYSDINDTVGRVLTYRLKAQDKDANLSTAYSKAVTIETPPPTRILTGIAWKFLNTISDSARVGDTVSVTASFTNANRKNDRQQWFIEKKDSLVKTVFDSSHFVCDTMRFCWHDTSEKKIFFAVTDKAAVTWWDSTSIHIVQDIPVAHPGRDTTVTINSSVRFLGTASLRFGTIVMNKWDFNGDGLYDDSSVASGAMTYIYTHAATYTAVFYVREDNGSEAKDSLKVTVVNSAPMITSIRNDTTISINDSIALFATATDTDGTIKEYAWSYTGDGIFEYTSPTTISTGYRYTNIGVYNVILLVKDDDGKAVYDTAVITVLRDAPLADAGNDTVVFINAGIHLHATATQQFGTITRWQWKIGSGDWTTTGGPDTSFSAPSTEQSVNCSFAATDDDGNTVTDEMKVSVILRVQSVAAGYLFSLILRSDGTLWGCGNGSSYGAAGSSTPKLLMGDVKNMDAGYSYCLILKNNGTLWVCGNNKYGQLGTGDTLYRGVPVQIMADVQNMSAGNFHSLILKNDGTLWGCGSTWDPTPILIMSDVKSMDAGYSHSLILKNDGTLWACGNNHDGQLGTGDTISRNTPVQIMSEVQNMSAGDYHSLIIKIDGTLWSCGGNSRGQLCDGTNTPRTFPIQVMSGVRSVDAHCNRRSMILKTDGTLWVCGNIANFCMGFRLYDCQIYGDGGRDGILTQIMSDVQSMAAAPDHYMVIKTDGALWTCGSNFYGQIGNGTSSSIIGPTPPVQIIPPQM